jgi:hypothetical protein
VSEALVFQHAKSLRPTILSSVAHLVQLYFSALSHKRHDFRTKVTEYKILFWFSLQNLVWKLSHFKIMQRHNITNVKTPYCSQILTKHKFSRQIFFKNSNIKFYSNPSSKSRVVLCGRTDRHTHMIKLIVDFRYFAKAPKNLPASLTFCSNCKNKPIAFISLQWQNASFWLAEHKYFARALLRKNCCFTILFPYLFPVVSLNKSSENFTKCFSALSQNCA